MNDIEAREEQDTKRTELSQRLREQRPMFQAMYKEMLEERFYQNFNHEGNKPIHHVQEELGNRFYQ